MKRYSISTPSAKSEIELRREKKRNIFAFFGTFGLVQSGKFWDSFSGYNNDDWGLLQGTRANCIEVLIY